ncbi:MAG: DM13 domain-containing protein [Erythrobacter sp.]|nr:DM13 domain-containing protein [Altererythrobacter sp.]NNC54042.1 DM13 domain-containing protein [Erythrobacter sp.]
MKKLIAIALSALVILGAGIYLYPILTAEDAPDSAQLDAAEAGAEYTAQLTRDLRGSDALHWGEGQVSVSAESIAHRGELAPGPDYKLYLTKGFVEHEDEFEPVKSQAALIGSVKSYDGFLLEVPEGVDIDQYDTVVVWCETFGEFITAARYR